MDIYFTTEEKYLKAVDKLSYGRTTKGLRLLNEIIDADPFYARAHYQLGVVNYYDVKDYQAAGYHFKTCVALQPDFPDVYYDYMHLLAFLDMGRQLETLKTSALQTPGVDQADIYNILGSFAEKHQKWVDAAAYYRKAFMAATSRADMNEAEENLKRIALKTKSVKAYEYFLIE